MSEAPSTASLLLLDLRTRKRSPLPTLAGLLAIEPQSGSELREFDRALGVFVAVDGDAADGDWQFRYQQVFPNNVPHAVLLDPYDPALASRLVQGDAADCCAIDDVHRIELIAARFGRWRCVSLREEVASSAYSHLVRLQATVDTLPIPIFIKDRNRRYVACNKAFESYLGVPAAKIVDKTVFDFAARDMARLCDHADIEQLSHGRALSYESRVRYADGSLHDVIFHKAVVRDPDGQPDGIVGAMLDISERKALERRLEALAATDLLTGAYNLRTFYELGRQQVGRLAREGGEMALALVDIDHFKDINDSLGHAAGDHALKQFVGVVRENLRECDILARAGGDEFRLLLPDTQVADAHVILERIRSEANRIIVRNHRGRCRLSISVGLAACHPGDESLDIATADADDALYQAKAAGRNCIQPPVQHAY